MTLSVPGVSPDPDRFRVATPSQETAEPVPVQLEVIGAEPRFVPNIFPMKYSTTPAGATVLPRPTAVTVDVNVTLVVGVTKDELGAANAIALPKVGRALSQPSTRL